MLKLSGEESNYIVLEKVLEKLKLFLDGTLNDGMMEFLVRDIELFLEPKREIHIELELLSIKARGGDIEAAKQLITELAKMKDGI